MSTQESKLPFIIFIPFAAVVFIFSLRSGAPQKPSMPGVVIPSAPVILPPVVPKVSAEAPATLQSQDEGSAESSTASEPSSETSAEVSSESWE